MDLVQCIQSPSMTLLAQLTVLVWLAGGVAGEEVQGLTDFTDCCDVVVRCDRDNPRCDNLNCAYWGSGSWNVLDVYKQNGWHCYGEPDFFNDGHVKDIHIGSDGRWYLMPYYESCESYNWILRSDDKYRSCPSQVTKWSNDWKVNTDQMRTRDENTTEADVTFPSPYWLSTDPARTRRSQPLAECIIVECYPLLYTTQPPTTASEEDDSEINITVLLLSLFGVLFVGVFCCLCFCARRKRSQVVASLASQPVPPPSNPQGDSARQEAVRRAREVGMVWLNQDREEGRQGGIRVEGRQGEVREEGRQERGLPQALAAPSAPPEIPETRPEAPPSYNESLYM